MQSPDLPASAFRRISASRQKRRSATDKLWSPEIYDRCDCSTVISCIDRDDMGPVRRGALYQTRSHCFTFSGATSLRLNSRTPQKIRSRTAIGSAYTFFTTGLGRGSPIIIVPAEKLGFWQFETSSLRDFPQQFRTFEILRNNR